MIRRFCCSVIPATLLLPMLLTGHTGGWVTITVADLPDYVVARQPTNLVFTIRQHGMEPVNSVAPTVEAWRGSERVTVTAVRTKQPGAYAATLNVPEPGEWQVSIRSGFGPQTITLMPIRAIGAGALDRPNFSPAERGQRLFIAKGCVTCHQRSGLERAQWEQCLLGTCASVKIAPTLVAGQFTADYLKRFLADPSIKPPTTNFRMPNLQLKPEEMSALIAFLNGELVKVSPLPGVAKKKSD